MKIIKSRKAVSPVIATLLLIAIAVASAVVAYAWVMGFIGTATATTSPAQGQITVEEVTGFKSGAASFTAYIRNTGSVQVNATDVYLTDNTAGTATIKCTVTPKTISPGKVEAVAVSGVSPVLVAGHTYSIKAVCSDGTTAVTTLKAAA